MSTSTYLDSAPSLEPYGKHWKASRTKQCKDDEQLEYEIVAREVGRDVHCVGKDWARTLYHHIATSEDIKEFCNHPSSGFDIEEGQWTVLPKDPTDASELREPLVRLISTIITHFYPSLPAGVARSIVGPQEGQGLHDGGKHDIRPFIAIKAKGPSFAVPAKANEIGANGLGYCNIAAMVNVCLHKARGSRREQAEQSVRHCRQIFTQQANRCFARSMVITELGFRLIHHDRSGVYVTPWFSIHKEKEVFVRFVLGLCSPNEEDLGLDTAVQWDIDERTGRKVAGTIKVNEYDEEKETSQTVVYDLVMNKPPLLRPCIRSRGTVVWHAIHPTTGKPVIIKDAWRPSTQGGEYEYLLAARGIPGVVQIMGYEDRCAETIGYRPQDFEAPHFEDRIKLRLVLMEYGPCVSQFKTRLELFKALRDVLIGHRKLIDAGVLHRDISLQNILFGPADASEGQRGVLIDLDLAVWADGWSSPVDPDPRVGTRMYQSIAICRSSPIDLVPDQTYLDDLESLFYVVSHFLFGFNKPACMLPHRSISLFFRYLGSHDQELAAEAKNGYSLGPLCLRDVPSFWGKPCRTLLKDFQAIIREILVKKAEIRGDEDFNDDERLEAYDELAQQSDVYFKQVKATFDKVIAALEEEGMNTDELEVAAKSRVLPQSAVPLAPASITAVAPGVSAVPVAAAVPVTPMDNAACNVPSSSHPPPPAASTVVTPHEVLSPCTSAVLTAGAEPAAEILASRVSPGASKKRPLDDGPHKGTPSKRHRNKEQIAAPLSSLQLKMKSPEPESLDSSSHSYTATGSSVATSLYTNSSIEVLGNAQYIYSLHEQNLKSLATSKKNLRTSKNKDDEQYEIIMREVGRNVYGVGTEWTRLLYHDMVSDEDINEFLNTTDSGYDVGLHEWKSLPKNPADVSETRAALVKIMSTIIAHFYPSFPAGVTREVIDSHEAKLVHDNGRHYSHPSIAIKAEGPSFEVPENATGDTDLGYTNMTGMVDVRIDESMGSRRQQVEHVTVQCRQIFLQQPNRHFSRSMVVTEERFRLVHYDRSGIYVTPLFNIHSDKEVFIRFILGLSSPEEDRLGLDTSVQWTIDHATGRKVAGTIKVRQQDESTKVSNLVVYNLNVDEPPFVRPGIRGRGTTAWRATDPITGENVIIKDAWRTSTQPGECGYLLAARGIPGVVQLLGYEDRCAETINYRPPDFEASHFQNRLKLRVVMKRYGSCISQFRSRLMLFKAIRDAIIGHRKLIEQKVLHRDVSLQNILFGPADAVEGDYGVLIDLDMAVWVDNWISPIKADARIGTRMYQSIAVCRSLSVKLVPCQSYLDDLESFLYVVVHLVYGFCKPATMLHNKASFLEYWNSDNQELVGEAKNGFVLSPLVYREIPPFWGKPCRTLLKEFHAVIREIVLKQAYIRGDEEMNDEERLKAYQELAEQGDVYYQQVKAAFDKVIATLEKEGPNEEEIEAAAKFSRSNKSSAPKPASPVAPDTPASPAPAPVPVIPIAKAGSDVSSPAAAPAVSAVTTPDDLPVTVAPTQSPADEKLVIESSGSSVSSGASKKRPSDDDIQKGTPMKRHRKEEGVTVPSPAGSSKPRGKADTRSTRATSALAGKGRSSRSPAS